jgi:hypothetical protein
MLLASSVSGLFKWRQFESEVIPLAVGWYVRFSLSYRDVEELLAERGITIRERPLRSSSFSHKITPEDARLLGRVIFFRDDGASLRHPRIAGLV